MTNIKPNLNSQGPSHIDALAFLQKLRPNGPWVLTAIVPDGATTTITARTPDQAEAFIRKHDGKRNLYYSVNPTRTAMSRKAKKTDIAAIEYALADLDPNADETSEAAKARYLKQLNGGGFEPKPTCAVDSGNGIQGLWKLKKRIVLDKPINGKFSPEDQAKIDDVEARIKAVMLKLGSKPGTQNIDRILRLPGTTNLPDEKKRKQGRVACPTKLLWINSASHPLDAFPASIKTDNVVDLNGNPLDWSQLNWAERYGFELDDELEELIDQGAPKGDRSDQFHRVVCVMLEQGWSREEILARLKHSPKNGIAEKYRDRLPWAVDYSIERRNKKQAEPEETVEIAFVDLARDPIPPRQWLVQDRIPMGNVTLFSGEGATGKSIVAKQLSAAVVLGSDWLGLTPMQGKVLYLSCEEDEDELRRRFDNIAFHSDVTRGELMEKGLHVISRVMENSALATPDKNGIMQTTPFYTSMCVLAGKIQPKLIVLDTSADVFAGNEINRNQVSDFVKLLRAMAIAAGNAAVLLISHPSLAGMDSGSGISGSTAWHNRVRARMYIKNVKDDEDEREERELEFLKNQYGPKNEKIRLYWNDGRFLERVSNRPDDAMSASDLFLHLVERYDQEGRNVSDKPGTTYAPAKFCEEPEAKHSKVSNKELTQAMLMLFATGKIRVETEGPPSKLRSRIVINRKGPK